MRIAVCITTYKRADGLVRLLGSLAAMRLPDGAENVVRVVIVDNDGERSGESAATGFDAPGWMRVEYICEARRGISQARNRALREAMGEDLEACDAVVFVDDDEVVEPGWLAALVETKERYSADVVAGPVLPRFEGGAPEWAERGGFFGRIRHETGTQLEHAATGNVLIGARVVREIGAWFDEALGLVGGEDVLFFRRVHGAGYTIVWCNEAVAHEYVEADRVRVGWVLRRAERLGATSAYMDRVTGRGFGAVVRHIATGKYRIAKGSAVYVLGIITGRKHVWVSGLRHIWYGLGHVFGAMGRLPEVYR